MTMKMKLMTMKTTNKIGLKRKNLLLQDPNDERVEVADEEDVT